MPSYNSLRLSSRLFQSDIQAIGTYIYDLENKAKGYSHHFIGVEFFSDAIGTPATPTGGTYDITVETQELPDIYQAPASNTVTASSVVSVNFSGNPLTIQFEPTSITGATHFRINLKSNRT